MVHHVLHVLMDTTMMLMREHVFLKENVLPMFVIVAKLSTMAAPVKRMKVLPNWDAVTKIVDFVLTNVPHTTKNHARTSPIVNTVMVRVSAWSARMDFINKSMLVNVLHCPTAGILLLKTVISLLLLTTNVIA